MWVDDAMREAADLLARSGHADLASDLSRILHSVDLNAQAVLRLPNAEDLADQIFEADSIDALSSCLEQFTKVFEVDHCTLHVADDHAPAHLSPRVITTYPDSWVSRYVECNYYAVDPVISVCREASDGFDWDALDYSNPQCAAFQSDAAEHGVGPCGFTQIVLAESGCKYAVSVSASGSPHAFTHRIRSFEDDLREISNLLAAAFETIVAVKSPLGVTLNSDHIALLRALARGFDREQMENLEFQHGSLQMAEASLCAQLGAKTLTQAAICAAQAGLLDAMPFDEGDIVKASSGQSFQSIARASNVHSMSRWLKAKQRMRGDGSPSGRKSG